MLVTFVLVCIGVKYANQMQSSISVSYEIGILEISECEPNANHVTSIISACKEAEIKAIYLLFQGLG